PRWKAVLGYDEDDDIQRNDKQQLLIHPDDIETTKENLKKHLKGMSEIYINEYRLKHKDGHYLWVLERGLALFDEMGKPYRMAGTITDITDRKKQEEEIKLVNQALLEERRMFIKGKVVVFRVNANNFKDIVYMSENVGDVLGYSLEDFMNKQVDFSAIVHPDDRELHKQERDLALKQKVSHVEFSVYRIIKKNNEVIYVKDFITIIRNQNDEPTEFLGYFLDVTKEKLAEKAIIENQQKYFALFSEANDAILMILGEKIIDCNTMAEGLFGYSKSELLNLNILKISPEKQPSGTASVEKRERKIKAAFAGEHNTFYWQYKKKSGELFDAEVSLSVVELNQNKYLHAIIRDISDRKKIEKELRVSQEKYMRLLDAMPDMIFIVDKKGNYLDYKPDKITGLEVAKEKIVGKSLDDFFTDEKKNEFHQKVEIVIQTGSIETIRYNLNSQKGMRNFEARISKLNDNEAFVQVRDFTENSNINI
ncbi:MAG: PAS domain S-box protein, partial [Bacteroidota bacterium]